MRVLLIDNYDSFTFNLLHLIRDVCGISDKVDVVFNDEIDLFRSSKYDSIVISPGPGIPSEAGNIMSIIKELSPFKSILGICLGHQAIAEVFGASIYCCDRPVHGVQTSIDIHDNSTILRGLGNEILAGRYHSWLVCKESIPDDLKVIATDNVGNVMAISHNRYNVHGVQFHPESFMTEQGGLIMKNFLYT